MGVTGSRDSVIGVPIRLQTGRPRNRGSIPSRGMRLYLSQSVQTGSGAHTTTSSVSTVGSLRDRGRGDLPPLPNSEVNGWIYTSIFHTLSWRARGQLYVIFTCIITLHV